MQFKSMLYAALAASMASAQSSNMTLTAALNSTSDLSSLSALLSANPDLAASISNRTNITLLAPSNDAISALTNNSQATALLNNTDAVSALLNYHVIQGVYESVNISSTPAFPRTYLNDTTYTNITGGQVVEVTALDNGSVVIYSGYRNRANVQTADLNFTNGVIHVIDRVLTIPGSIVDTAVTGGFTDLVGAIQLANLTDTLDSLNESTIFAPTNAAFSAIGSVLGNATQDQLQQILEYHVVNGTVAYSSTLTNGSAPTVQGNNITITIEDGAVFVNQARVIVADVLVANGVAHVIDSVLNPNNTNATADATATTAPIAYTGASSSSIDITSSVPSATTTAGADLTSSQSAVASGYSTTPSSIGENPAATGTAAGGSSSSSAMAAAQTGAMGAAALFGAGAFLANL